jgi:hypothetical protein
MAVGRVMLYIIYNLYVFLLYLKIDVALKITIRSISNNGLS